jgi:hypothetical protein
VLRGDVISNIEITIISKIYTIDDYSSRAVCQLLTQKKEVAVDIAILAQNLRANQTTKGQKMA